MNIRVPKATFPFKVICVFLRVKKQEKILFNEAEFLWFDKCCQSLQDILQIYFHVDPSRARSHFMFNQFPFRDEKEKGWKINVIVSRLMHVKRLNFRVFPSQFKSDRMFHLL